MVEIIPAPDHVAAYRIAGTLNADDYRILIADFEAKLAKHDKLGVLVDLTGFKDFTWEAVGRDISYSLSKFGQLNRFPREAVITDKVWIATLAKVASPLLPFMEIRTFAPEDREEALAWVADIPTR